MNNNHIQVLYEAYVGNLSPEQKLGLVEIPLADVNQLPVPTREEIIIGFKEYPDYEKDWTELPDRWKNVLEDHSVITKASSSQPPMRDKPPITDEELDELMKDFEWTLPEPP